MPEPPKTDIKQEEPEMFMSTPVQDLLDASDKAESDYNPPNLNMPQN